MKYVQFNILSEYDIFVSSRVLDILKTLYYKTLEKTKGTMHPFCNLQNRARTHAVLVIGLYELLGNLIT
jgi:hypothetical protein